MKALKTVVILLAVVIVAGFGFVVYTIVDRLLAGEPVLAARDATRAEAEPPTAPVRFGEIELPVPPGCDLDSARIEEGRLLVTLGGLLERGCQQILMLDLKDGSVLGRITARPETVTNINQGQR